MHAPSSDMSGDPMKGDPLAGFVINYDRDICFIPCATNGCHGHVSDIPVAFTLGGMSFAVEYPDIYEDAQDREAEICRVIEILQALSELIAARPPWTPKASPENLEPPSENTETQKNLPPP